MTRSDIDEKLWSYIDGDLPDRDKPQLEALVKNDSQWRAAYQELLSVHELLHSGELEEPSMRFTRNVMEEISRYHITPATRTYINKNIVYGLGIFFGVLIIGLLVFFAFLINSSPASPSAATFDTDLDRFNWSRLLSSTYLRLFLMANTVLMLMLADRFLNRKKQAVEHK